jgi:hypothetical protein
MFLLCIRVPGLKGHDIPAQRYRLGFPSTALGFRRIALMFPKQRPGESSRASIARSLLHLLIICAAFWSSAIRAFKKSAITQAIRLQQNKIRQCAISLLIMNTRAFLPLFVGINLAAVVENAQSHEVPPKGGGPALSISRGPREVIAKEDIARAGRRLEIYRRVTHRRQDYAQTARPDTSPLTGGEVQKPILLPSEARSECPVGSPYNDTTHPLVAQNMSPSQKQMLVLLSEAHEEDLLSLVNTILKSSSAERLQTVVNAIRGLLVFGHCLIATYRDPVSRHWVPLPERDSLDRLTEAIAYMSWDCDQSFWEWGGSLDRPQVLLTERGVEEAERILEEDGWIV